MLGRLLKTLFAAPPAVSALERYKDDVFGDLMFVKDDDCWQSDPGFDDRGYKVSFKGKLNEDSNLVEPDPEHIAAAETFLGDKDSFNRGLNHFLTETSKEYEMHGSSAVVRSLKVDEITILSPSTGMIFFADTGDDRVWRCDVIAGELRNLGFDS